MNFQDLHELLRLELLRRVEHGSLTGTSLARQASFRQAHISNFLNRKRALSLDGLDRYLLLNTSRWSRSCHSSSAQRCFRQTNDPMDAIPVVSPSTAMDDAQVRPEAIIETMYVSASRLQDNRSRPSPRCAHWQRFLAVRADAQLTAAMEPMLASG